MENIATFRGIVTKAYRGSTEICSNCDATYSSRWFRSARFDVIVCRVCKSVHEGRVGEGDLGALAVQGSRPVGR